MDHGVVVYLDDILIYYEDMDDHIKLVQKVLDWHEQQDLAVSLKKSVFHHKEVEFLGYIVKTGGVTMSDIKVKCVQSWAHLRSVKEVQIFIGFRNLYRLFMDGFLQSIQANNRDIEGQPKGFSVGTRAGRGI